MPPKVSLWCWSRKTLFHMHTCCKGEGREAMWGHYGVCNKQSVFCNNNPTHSLTSPLILIRKRQPEEFLWSFKWLSKPHVIHYCMLYITVSHYWLVGQKQFCKPQSMLIRTFCNKANFFKLFLVDHEKMHYIVILSNIF